MIATSIHARIDAQDEYCAASKTEEKDSPYQCGHVYLGSPQPSIKISDLILANRNNSAFQNFPRKLAVCLADLQHQEQPIEESSHGSSEQTKVHTSDTVSFLTYTVIPPTSSQLPLVKVTECRLLEVNYESKITQRQVTDILRCSPMFYNALRHDFVMVNAGPNDTSMLCRLILVFTYSCKEQCYALALVQPFDALL